MSENSLILNESSQANYLTNLNRLTKLNSQETNQVINQKNEMNHSDQTKLKANQMTKNLFTVDSLLKGENNRNGESNNDLKNDFINDDSQNDHKLADETEDEIIDDQQFDDEKSLKSDSEELNVDREENSSNELIDVNYSNNQLDQQLDQQLNQQNSSLNQNNFKSIEELYKSSIANQTSSNNQSITTNSLLPSSSFLSNLPFSNHNPHFQALLASHLAPYTTAFNAAFNSNSFYLNNLLHQTKLDNVSQQVTNQSSGLSLTKAQPPSSYSTTTVLEDNLRQALLAAQSNSVNNQETKHGHSLNLISSFNSTSMFLF